MSSSILSETIRKNGHMNRGQRRELVRKYPRLARIITDGVRPISSDVVNQFMDMRQEDDQAVTSRLPMSMIFFGLGLIGIFVLLTGFTTMKIWMACVICFIFFVAVLVVSHVFKDIEKMNEDKQEWKFTDFQIYARQYPVPETVKVRALKVWRVCENTRIFVYFREKKAVVSFPVNFSTYRDASVKQIFFALIEDGKLVD